MGKERMNTGSKFGESPSPFALGAQLNEAVQRLASASARLQLIADIDPSSSVVSRRKDSIVPQVREISAEVRVVKSLLESLIRRSYDPFSL